MKKISLVLFAVLGLASAGFSIAARPHYDYVNLQYLHQKLDSGAFSCTQDGFGLGGSLALDEQIYILASYSDVSGDGCGSQFVRAGAGLRSDYGTSSSFFLNGTVFNMDIDGGESGVGYGVAGGIRTYLKPGVEAYGQLAYDNVDIDGVDLGITASAGVVYGLRDGFSLTGELALGQENDATAINVGIRYNF